MKVESIELHQKLELKVELLAMIVKIITARKL